MSVNESLARNRYHPAASSHIALLDVDEQQLALLEKICPAGLFQRDASLGAAINTAVCLGLYPCYQTAIENMVQIKDVFMPIEENAARYDALNKGIFRELTTHTDVILKKSWEVFHGDLNQVEAIQSWSNV